MITEVLLMDLVCRFKGSFSFFSFFGSFDSAGSA